MKRFTAILVLLTLLSSYTGVQVCVDYCCDTIESIHFGLDRELAHCHIDDCGSLPESDCCDSEQFELEPQLLNFTYNQLPELKSTFVYINTQAVQLNMPTLCDDQSYLQLLNAPWVTSDVRALTQVSRC